MPSEAAKKRQAQKKERRQAVAKKKQQQSSQKPEKQEKINGESSSSAQAEGACAAISDVSEELTALSLSARSCTGVLSSHPASRDVHIDNFSLTFHGAEIFVDTRLELNCGRRYGLVGLNGSGKSTLLAALGAREVPIPDHVDIFHLSEEMPASDKTPLQCVMEVDEERYCFSGSWVH